MLQRRARWSDRGGFFRGSVGDRERGATRRTSHGVTLGKHSRHGQGSMAGASALAQGQEEGCWRAGPNGPGARDEGTAQIV